MQIGSLESITNNFDRISSDNKIEGKKDFGEVLELALSDANNSEVDNKLSTAELLSGDDSEIHDVMIKAQKAELTLDFVIQVRNKMIDAYDAVMKMQV